MFWRMHACASKRAYTAHPPDILSTVRRNSLLTISCVMSQLSGVWNDLWRSKERDHLNCKPFSEWLLVAERFGDYASWISYTDFRTQANATIDVVYMTPREAKNHHGRELSGWRGHRSWHLRADSSGIDCLAGQTVEMPDGRMSIFEDGWWYSRIKCLWLRASSGPHRQRLGVAAREAWKLVR